MDTTRTEDFERERPRLVGLATRVLGDHAEAEDIVQHAWLRLHGTDTDIESLPAWLTTVTTRLCLDRLRSRTPLPHSDVEPPDTTPDVADDVVLADTVGVALQTVIDRLSPGERVAFVLHDSFGFDFATIAAILDTSPAAARKLASRARAKVRGPVTGSRGGAADGLATRPTRDWEVVDAFMAASREGDFDALLALLAPQARITADAAAIATGTPERIDGRREIAGFFDGSAHAAVAVLVDGRPGSAWFHRGEAKVLFDFTIEGGVVRGITFRADPELLGRVTRREDLRRRPVTSALPRSSSPRETPPREDPR
ncbi:sigma-70 family RNA polymerase sigma factor [Janibacter terrae]|uniref:sigma-70 family RNA polymerase sigma factor n=1 Tax=Janibacter terrae TaxID=103817 RepID=UPI000838FDAA|nr:sigma-70 family RNA polymerase sigma factor [Janibacter terrae]